MKLFCAKWDETGFPKKIARFSKMTNIPNLLSEKEGKIMKHVEFFIF